MVSDPPAGPRPRLWPTLLLVAAVGPAAVVVSMLALPLVAWAAGDPGLLGPAEDRPERLAEAIGRPEVAAALLLPVQLLLAGLAVWTAARTRGRATRVLGLERPRLDASTLLLALLAMPAVQVVGGLLAYAALGEPDSEHLDLLQRMFTVPQGAGAGAVLLLGALAPGICEELLFRGAIQRRLLARLRPPLAIVLASVAFAALHLDPHQALGVLPIGLYLGLVAWRADSVWPAIALHAANNLWAAHLAREILHASDPGALGGIASVALAAFLPLGLVLWRLVGRARETAPPAAGA